MLETLRMGDFSLRYSVDNLAGEERKIAEEINLLIKSFHEAELRHKSELHFYEALLSKVDSILIATDDNGRVRWMNKTAIERLCGFKFDAIEYLSTLHPSLPAQLMSLRKEHNKLISFTMPGGEERQYSASLTNIFVGGICYKLYNLQSVTSIVKQSEIEAQQRLIRVLTHEIMNSLAPIMSLSDTLMENMASGTNCNITDEEVHLALSAINRRANAMMQFVQKYRRLSGIAAPSPQIIGVDSFIGGLQELFRASHNDVQQVIFDVRCSDVKLHIDRSQMEQVFINLLKNAIETKATLIKMVVTVSDDKRWLIASVEDNGGGFSAEVEDNLFTPFFSTKQNGEGIGLAICRSIVYNHGGFIAAGRSEDGAGARFSVRLPLN